MREAGSKWMRMRHSLHSGSQTMLLLTVPSVIVSFGLPIENITAGNIVLDFAVIQSMHWAPYSILRNSGRKITLFPWGGGGGGEGLFI